MSSQHTFKQYTGNNLNVNLRGSLDKSYLITGNNCRITANNNTTLIKVVGNNCEVYVESGTGSVLYVGNNGSVFLGPNLDDDVVNFVGNNGRILRNQKIGRHNSDSDISCDKAARRKSIFTDRLRTKVTRRMNSLGTISLPNIQINIRP